MSPPSSRPSGGVDGSASSAGRRVYDLLRAEMLAGERPPGEQLVEGELTATLGVSRADVRYALQKLAEEGVVFRRPRLGTRISQPSYQIAIDDIVPFERAESFRVRVTDYRLMASTRRVREQLETDATQVGYVQRLCEDFSEAVPVPVAVAVAYCRVEHHERLHSVRYSHMRGGFEEVYGRELGAVETVVSAAVCDEYTAQQLAIPAGTVLLTREQRLRAIDGVIYQYVFSHYRADRVAFHSRAFRQDHEAETGAEES